MKRLCSLLLAFCASATAFAHGDVELGPNKGRLLQVTPDKKVWAEATLRGDAFHLALLDEAKQPLPVGAATLTALTADRRNPQTLAVTTVADGFTVAKPAGEKFFLILSYKAAPEAKSAVFRLPYDGRNCGDCQKAEWLCACSH
jgi:hypothetical protein